MGFPKAIAKAVLTSNLFQAVVGGTLVYFVGVYFEHLYIIPLTRYNELRSEVCYCLTQYANAYLNPCCCSGEYSDVHKEASTELRKIASKLEAFAQERKFIAFFSVPSKNELKEVAGWLRRLSNSMTNDVDGQIICNRRDANAIRLYLSLDVEYYEGLYAQIDSKRFQKKIPMRFRNRVE